MTESNADWRPVADLESLPPGAVRAVQLDDARVAVFRLPDGSVRAVDDVCPHEGYPLSKGDRAGETLTCCYHNFKFDLRDGRCLKGDERVRVFDARVRAGAIELDVAPPDPTAAIAARRESLREGVLQRRLGQVARDLARLLRLGVTPTELLRDAVALDATYGEWGTTHVLPVAADVLGLLSRRPDREPLLPLLLAFELAADGHTRRPPRPTPPVLTPDIDLQAAGAALCAAIERDDVESAEGLLRGALANGAQRADVEPWLWRVASAHFLDLGHAAIYQNKAFDLLEAWGWDAAIEVLPAHLARMGWGTRHDALPSWRWLRRRVDDLAPQLAVLWSASSAGQGTVDREALVQAIAFGRRDAAVDAVVEAMRAGAPLVGVVDALVLAASERLCRFDIAFDRDPTRQDDWLDVTHAFTFASALRGAVERFRDPEVVRLLLYSAAYTNRIATLDGALEPAVAELPERDAVEDALLADDRVRPIAAAHLLKASVAGWLERAATADDRPLRGVLRYLADPGAQRSAARLAHEAHRLVVEGKVPRAALS